MPAPTSTPVPHTGIFWGRVCFWCLGKVPNRPGRPGGWAGAGAGGGREPPESPERDRGTGFPSGASGPDPSQAADCVCSKGKESFLLFYSRIMDTRQSSPFSAFGSESLTHARGRVTAVRPDTPNSPVRPARPPPPGHRQHPLRFAWPWSGHGGGTGGVRSWSRHVAREAHPRGRSL